MKFRKFKLNKRIEEKLKRLAQGGIIYTADSWYSGGWKHAEDHTNEYTEILEKLGRKWKTGNSAPRGGLNGKFIKCKKFDFEKAKELLTQIELAEKIKNEIETIDKYFRTKSKSGNRYLLFSKPYSATPDDYTLRITPVGIFQIAVNGEWHNCKR